MLQQIIPIRLQALGIRLLRIIRDGFTIMVFPFDLLFNHAIVNLLSQRRIRARLIAHLIVSPSPSYFIPSYPCIVIILRDTDLPTYLPTLFRRNSTIAIQVLFHASEQANRK